MADPITVQCPHCKVKLKLKAVPPAGKKVGCPKCKKPFPVKAPKKKDDDDFLDALDDLNEEDYDAPEDESEEQEEEAPASRSTLRSRSSVTRKGTVKGKKKGGKKSSGGPILAIIGGSVAALALVAGLVYLLMNLPGGGGAGGGGGIRSASGEFIAFLPPDAEVFVTARPADIMASPFAAPLQQNPQAKMGFAQIEQSLGFPLAEIEHVFFGVKVTPNAGNPAAGPMGGNPMMGMPGGMPGGPGGMPGAMPGGMPGGPGGMPGMGMPGGNRAPTADVVAVLRLKQPYGGKTLEQISQQSPPKTHKGVQYHVNAGPNAGAFFFAGERHVVMTEPAQIEKVIDRKDQPENNSFLAYLAKDQHITLVAAPKQSGAFAKLPPGLSGMMPDQNAQKLLEDVTTVRLDVNLPGGIDLKVTLTCKSDSAAQQIHAETTKQIDQLKQQVGFLKLVVPEIDSVLNTLQVNQSGSTMSVAVSVPKTTIEQLSQRGGQAPGGVSANAGLSQNSGLPGASGAGVPGISSIGLPTGVPTTAPNGTDSADPTASLNEAANRTKAMNNLKQVLLAFHNHHDTHGSFPAAFSADAAGTPLLSWRVHILPFLEQKDLYDQFHLNEPWDSEHNKTLIARMPAVFASDDADLASQGLTRFVVSSGPGMAFEGKDPLRLRDFLDGTSLTIAAVEVARDSAVIWTKPDDLIFDPEMPLQNLEGARGEYFLAGFADGATRLIKTSIAADLLKALFTRKGMEPIPANAIP